MSSVNLVTLNNARTTFQRLSDARIYHGWVQHMGSTSATIQTWVLTEPTVGEQFSFQVFGNRRDAFFEGELLSCTRADPDPELDIRFARAILVDLKFEIAEGVIFRDSHGDARFKVTGVIADIQREPDIHCEGTIVVDISSTGFAAVTDAQMAKGDKVRVKVYAHRQIVEFEAEARNCRPCGADDQKFRMGFHIGTIDRVDAIRWKRIYWGVLDEHKASLPNYKALLRLEDSAA